MAKKLGLTPQRLTHQLMALGIHVPKERTAHPNLIMRLRREATIITGQVVSSQDIIKDIKHKHKKTHLAAKALGVRGSTLSRLCTMYGLPWRAINDDERSGELD